MKQIILGTAGHIDHGKTSLIKAMTGINTDRLKEEQARGITIELGFAFMNLPSGQRIGIVDVPGHEKFVKNMVAGASGIDMVAMVIAADEGVMPQTREHMEICSLLGVQHGVVALTKIDMVDEEWLALVIDDIESFVVGTFLEGAPIMPVSSATEEGVPEFLDALDDLANNVPAHATSGLFRLPVDRVFTMKGFGTVITGTLISGQVGVGEQIMIYPSGITSKVRGLQVHNQSVETAQVGQRTAINFQGLEKASIARGEVVARPGSLSSSYMLDLRLQFLNSNKKPIKTRTQVRFHTGTSEIMGKLIFIDREELAPGDTTVAQIRLDSPVAVVKGDRYVLRSYSPVRTIGGGQVLNPLPRKLKQADAALVPTIESLSALAPEDIISFHAKAARYDGVSFTSLMVMTNLSEKQLDKALQGLLSRREVICVDKNSQIYVHQDVLAGLESEATGHLKHYHGANPLKTGMSKEELKSKVPPMVSDKLYHLMLNGLIRGKKVIVEGETIRDADHKVTLGIDQADAKKKILAAYEKNGLTPPYFKDVASEINMNLAGAKDVLLLLIEEGKLLKAKEDLYFSSQAMSALKEKLIDFLVNNEEISMSQFKELTGTSRKYSVPLLEYFDSQNVTLRIGDVRKLRKKVG